MATVPHVVRKRTIAKWETLVGRAIEAEEERTLRGSHWSESSGESSDTPLVPHLVRKRTIAKWETLVGRAIEAEEERTLRGSHWNEYIGTPFVPQILHQQKKNIDSILQTARSVQDQYPQVARILYEYSYALSQALDPRSESRGVLQFKTVLLSVIQQIRGEKTDRSEDVYIIEGFYKDLKRKLDELEDEDWLRQQPQYNQISPEGWAELKRDIYMKVEILNEVVDFLTKENPKIGISTPMNKAAEEVFQQNFGPALETLRHAIEIHSDGFLLLFRALVNHLLGQKEGVKRDLQEAERLLSVVELAEGTREHFTPAIAYRDISDVVGVPTYTTEKLCGKQMIVDHSLAVTENQRLNIEVRLTPSNMLRPDGNVELIVIVDSLRFEVVRSQTTRAFFSYCSPPPVGLTDRRNKYPDHFLQSLQILVRPTGKWSESFSGGFGLIKCSPGNELNPLFVQKGKSRGFTAGMNVGASPSGGVQLNGNNTSGTSFPAFGFKKSKRDGHAYVCEYELRTFEDGSSARNLRGRRFYRNPKMPEAVEGEVNYPNLGKDESFAGTWMVPEATAMKLRNEFEFTISVKAKLPAVWKCIKTSLAHLFHPPEPELEVRKVETRRICVFAIARLKSFIGKST